MHPHPDYNVDGNSWSSSIGLLRSVEHNARANVAAKIRKIVDKQFTVAVEEKESELGLLDEQILKVRKGLHLVRHGAVKTYYAPAQPKQTPENVSLHPAINKLLRGKHPQNKPVSDNHDTAVGVSKKTVLTPSSVSYLTLSSPSICIMDIKGGF